MVNFSCGHQAEVQLFGKYDDRKRRINYYEREGICPDCYEKLIKNNREKAKAEHIEQYGQGMVGTPKQIAFACDIIDGIASDYASTIEQVNRNESPEKWAKVRREMKADPSLASKSGGMVLMFCIALKEIKSAKWWIDHRFDYFEQIDIL